jgi:hypothetical protein
LSITQLKDWSHLLALMRSKQASHYHQLSN